jgi:hypothetical protein
MSNLFVIFNENFKYETKKVSFKFIFKVGVEESIVNVCVVNASRIQIYRYNMDQLFKSSNLTFCIVCVFTPHSDERSVRMNLLLFK